MDDDSTIGGRSTRDWLVDLRDPLSVEKRTRAAAALSLGGAAEAREVLRAATAGEDRAITLARQSVLVALGEPAVGPLTESLGDDFASSAFLVATLAAIGDPAAPVLRAIVEDRASPGLARVRALRALAAMRPLSAGVNDLLVRVLYDPAEWSLLRQAAASAIASWAPEWVAADPVGSGVLASCASPDEEVDRHIAACREAGEAAAAARELPANVPAPPSGPVREGEPVPAPRPPGWFALPEERSGRSRLVYFDGERWTAQTAARGLSDAAVTRLAQHEDVLSRVGLALVDLLRDLECLAAVEHDNDAAEAAGYRLVESRRAPGCQAAQRVRDLGARLRAEMGEEGPDGLALVLAELRPAQATAARELLRGGSWFLESD
jgi:hypothetical protein